MTFFARVRIFRPAFLSAWISNPQLVHLNCSPSLLSLSFSLQWWHWMEVFFGLTITSQVPSWTHRLMMVWCSRPIRAIAIRSLRARFLLEPGRVEVPLAEAVIPCSCRFSSPMRECLPEMFFAVWRSHSWWMLAALSRIFRAFFPSRLHCLDLYVQCFFRC